MNSIQDKRHTAAHLLATAILEMFPEAKFGVGPTTDTGFFYDFDLPRTLIPEDLVILEQKMKRLIKENHPVEGRDMDIDQAIDHFKALNQDMKVELLHDLKTHGTTSFSEIYGEKDSKIASNHKNPKIDSVSLYKTSDFLDLCRGGHTEFTGQLDLRALKLTKISSAYFRGDANNRSLQRVYGLLFDTKEELKQHLFMLAEAEKRDHKKLGREMELFFFHETAPGLPYWLPKGLSMKNLLIEFWRQYHSKRGYQETSAPLINKRDLWDTSGHWQHYKDDMFLTRAKGEDQWAVKPMNCPNAMNLFKFKIRSYHDLPLRLSNTDILHRNEIPGALNGLLRARTFQQDDSHNFVTEDQIKEEIKSIITIIEDFYSIFGLKDNVKLYLATRPDDYMGDIETWHQAEKELKEILESSNFNFDIKNKDGAFYGPKIDIHLSDALGREWQCGTVQLDFQSPRNFKLYYIDNEGAHKTPVVIHRVIYGSLERFIGIITEHFAGNFPFWFAPTQIKIVTINEDIKDYAETITEKLRNIYLEVPVQHNKIRFEVDYRNETLGKKIREAEMMKIPYVFVLGQKEKDEQKIAIRQKGQREIQVIDLDQLEHFLKSIS